MKVVRKGVPVEVIFGNVDCGVVFVRNCVLYMKIRRPLDHDVNAVSLENGMLSHFDNVDRVLPINGSFVEE